MSRSYKHHPYCNCTRDSKSKRLLRRNYNHSLRQKLKDFDFIIQHSDYKKVILDGWDVHCHAGYWSLKEAILSDLESKNLGEPVYNFREHKLTYDYDEEDLIYRWKRCCYYK